MKCYKNLKQFPCENTISVELLAMSKLMQVVIWVVFCGHFTLLKFYDVTFSAPRTNIKTFYVQTEMTDNYFLKMTVVSKALKNLHSINLE